MLDWNGGAYLFLATNFFFVQGEQVGLVLYLVVPQGGGMGVQGACVVGFCTCRKKGREIKEDCGVVKKE